MRKLKQFSVNNAILDNAVYMSSCADELIDNTFHTESNLEPELQPERERAVRIGGIMQSIPNLASGRGRAEG